MSELITQGHQHLVGERAVDPQFNELAREERLLEQGVGNQLGRGDEARRLVDVDLVLAIDDSAPKRDRRDVPFAGGPQAQDEPARSCGQAGLVGMPDHRRIEECRGLQSVFLGEIGAHEQLPVLAERLIGQEMSLDLFKSPEEELAGLLMPVPEFTQHVIQEEIDLRLGERRDPPQDPLDPVLAGRLERSDDNPAVVWPDDDSRPLHAELARCVGLAIDESDHAGMAARFESEGRAVTVHAEKLRGLLSRCFETDEQERPSGIARLLPASYHTGLASASLYLMFGYTSRST